MLYKITNLLSTSVTVGDLGINLPAGGTANVRADAWGRSNDARDLEGKRWVRADKQFVPGRPPVPVHPAPRPLDPPPYVAEPVSQSGVETPRVAGVVVSQESFDRYLRNQEELMKMMSSLMGQVPAGLEQINKTIRDMPAPAVVPFRPGMVHAHETSPVARGADPMFIPTKIIPEDAKAAIKVQEGEAKGVDDAAEALKNLRGRKSQ